MNSRVHLTFQTKPARKRIEKIRAALDGHQLSARQLSKAIKLDATWIYSYIHYLRDLGEVHIAAYAADKRTALFTLGPGEDAARPAPAPAVPKPKAPVVDQVEEDMRKAVEAARRKVRLWKPQRDPLIAAFFGGATV
ncbi:hypothetical protein Herbaro_09190 [Herbaspirillum sp. WKF16]|uniref:hypothetical protein n=1 Tax=Herbaspirillum sp. WKF16 TaxID=3028312 RepID=UPI0023A9DA7B|nr:hypothetical protein [Herbaspirillum sp. WKF16]WDZ97934.1 hypothetical protein Herbaro_09190 [Herbaspirillum sp. WKF16]